MPISNLKHLRVHTDPHGTSRYYFVATYAPVPATGAQMAPRPVTVRIRLAAEPDGPAFRHEYGRLLDSIQAGAVWVR